MIPQIRPRTASILLAGALAASLAGCDLADIGLPVPADAEVRVTDPAGEPIAGAVVTGGIDWESYRRVTDVDGRAQVPGRQLGSPADILAVNHLPRRVELQPTTYVLERTPARIESLGRVEGEVLRITEDRVSTFDRYGWWRSYALTSAGVEKELAVELRPAPDYAGHAMLFGDELWLMRSADLAAEVWSVADPLSPVRKHTIPGFGIFLARRGPLVVVRNPDAERTELWRVEEDGEARRLSSISRHVPAAAFVGEALYLLPWGGLLGVDELTVVDPRVPERPEVVGVVPLPGIGAVTFHGRRALLTPSEVTPGEAARHRVLDLSDALAPVAAREVAGHAFVTEWLTDDLALGFTPEPRVAALVGVRDGEMEVLATTTDEVAHVWPYPQALPSGANAGPLFGFAGHVWRLER